nr:hypothetical protein [Tanacetum cinerariifolium]
MKRQVNPLLKEAASLVGRSTNLWQSLPEPSRQKQFEGIIISLMGDQEEKLRQLKEYMNVISNEFMQLSSIVMEKLKDQIRAHGNEKIQKITRFLDKESKSLDAIEPLRTLDIKTPSPYQNPSSQSTSA